MKHSDSMRVLGTLAVLAGMSAGRVGRPKSPKSDARCPHCGTRCRGAKCGGCKRDFS